MRAKKLHDLFCFKRKREMQRKLRSCWSRSIHLWHKAILIQANHRPQITNLSSVYTFTGYVIVAMDNKTTQNRCECCVTGPAYQFRTDTKAVSPTSSVCTGVQRTLTLLNRPTQGCPAAGVAGSRSTTLEVMAAGSRHSSSEAARSHCVLA